MKYLILILCVFSIDAYSFQCFNLESEIWAPVTTQTKNHCWDIPKRYYDASTDTSFIPSGWYPTCDNTYANYLDPMFHGLEYYKDYWCPGGLLDLSIISGVNRFLVEGENNCDLFSPKGRVISSFWLLEALDRSNARGGDYFANWTSKIFSEINQNNGIIFTGCDLNNFNVIASNPGTIVVLNTLFLYSVPISKASATLVHEGQHDYTSHIRCSRGLGNRMACDRGIYQFNPGDSTYGSFTMDYIVFDELLGASSFETDNQDIPTLENFDVLHQDGSTRSFCRNKPLLNLNQKYYVFSQLNFDWQEQINTPMDPYRYTTLWEMDFDYFPSWLCSPITNCEEYIFAEGNEGRLSCNETLNSDNVAINQHNLDVCNRGIDAYTSALNEPGSFNQEAANAIHQNEINRREREGEQCLPITQEHLNQYCDSRINEATTAFNIDPFGYLEQYGQSNLDVCVQRYCEQPGIVNDLWNGLSGNEVYSTINRLSNGNINSYLRENYSASLNSCLEYFCGDDEKCKTRYIRYEGNLNIVNGDHSYCVEEYLTCIERSGAPFALEGYSRESGVGNAAIDLYEVVFDTEFNLSENISNHSPHYSLFLPIDFQRFERK